MSAIKRYIGDGVYVDFDGFALVLTTENGVEVTNRIVLEPNVYTQLVGFVASLINEKPEAELDNEAFNLGHDS